MSIRSDGGSAVGGGAFDPNNTITERTLLRIGTGFSVQFSDVDFAEIVSYGVLLSDPNTDLVGSYLAAKWGLTWTSVS